MLRLLVDAEMLAAGQIEVRESDHHYLFRVRRLAVGDELVAFDGEGHEGVARVAAVASERAQLEVGAVTTAPPPRPDITVLVSLIKGERMDWCVTKLVELGATRIVPVAAERSVVRLDPGRARKRIDRYRQLVRSATQQCRAGYLPRVEPVCGLATALELAKAAELKLVLWESHLAQPIGERLVGDPTRVALLVGPEGGLTDEELELAKQAGFIPVGLGPRVLRAETAAIAGATLVSHAFAPGLVSPAI